MARFDRAALDAATYPVRFEVQTRFADLDSNRHVNNVASIEILQEARVDFNRRAGLWDAAASGLRMMAVGLTVEFAGELHHPAPVEVSTATLAIGRSSFTIVQVARQEGRPAVYAQATMVFTDANGPVAIPDPVRRALEGLALA